MINKNVTDNNTLIKPSIKEYTNFMQKVKVLFAFLVNIYFNCIPIISY